MKQFTCLGLGLSLVLIGCQNPINDPIDSVVDAVTNPKVEIAKGIRNYPFALAQSGGDLTQFPRVTRYMNNLVQKLSKHTPAQYPWEVRLINDQSINAWALPGGKMGVNYGLILEAETEAELVSVLGHEMAHIIELHGTGRETFGTLVNIASRVIEIGISEPGTPSRSNRILNFGQNIIMSQYSQSNELEADRIGIDLMVRAGFDPRGAIGIQNKLAAMGELGNSLSQKLLGTHPISRERTSAIQNVVARYPPGGRQTSAEFEEVKAEIRSKLYALNAIQSARKAGNNKDFKSALMLVNKAITAINNEHSFWRAKAELLVATGQPREAVQAAIKARNLNPSDPISELLISYCYDALGDIRNANVARNRARRLIR